MHIVYISATHLLLFPPSKTAWNVVETSGVSLHKLAAQRTLPRLLFVLTRLHYAGAASSRGSIAYVCV